jgi:hypothetical protein
MQEREPSSNITGQNQGSERLPWPHFEGTTNESMIFAAPASLSNTAKTLMNGPPHEIHSYARLKTTKATARQKISHVQHPRSSFATFSSSPAHLQNSSPEAGVETMCYHLETESGWKTSLLCLRAFPALVGALPSRRTHSALLLGGGGGDHEPFIMCRNIECKTYSNWSIGAILQQAVLKTLLHIFALGDRCVCTPPLSRQVV